MQGESATKAALTKLHLNSLQCKKYSGVSSQLQLQITFSAS